MAPRKTTAAGTVTAPDTVDLQHPARLAELARLRAERSKLRDQLDGATVDELLLLRAEVDALKQVAARAGALTPLRHMTEGTREEIERLGYSTDPNTGAVLTRDDLPQ